MYKAPANTLRVAMARNPPDAFSDCKNFPTYSQSLNCEYPGWCLEVLSMITSTLKVNIDAVLTPWKPGEVVWGSYTEKTKEWSGTLGMLKNGRKTEWLQSSNQVDTICLMFQKTEVREEHFDFANTVLTVRPIYVVQQRQESVSEMASSLYSGFNVQLWVLMIVLTFLQYESKIYDKQYWNPKRTVWMLYEYFVDQKNDQEYPEPYSVSGKVTLTIWAFCQCVIMSGLYKGLLLSQLLNPKQIKPFNNVDEMIELIAAEQYSLTTNNLGNWYFDELLRSNLSHYEKLRSATKTNPVVPTGTVDEALDLVETGKYIYPIQEDSSAMQFAKKRCGLVFISEGLPERTTHFIFRKNSSWLKAWNEQIILTQNFQQRTFRKYFEDGYIIGEKPRCPTATSKLGKPLDIWTILGVVLVAVVGAIISLSALIVENITILKKKSKIVHTNTIF